MVSVSRFFAAALSLVALLLAAPQASAQSYPNRNVRIIVPFGAGGPADVYARVLAQYLSESLKQSFVVENRPGAGSIIGTDAVAKSDPDGYTLLLMSNTHTTNESLIPNKPFVLMRDFAPVATINYSDLLMVIHPGVPAKDLKEFIALAKKDPGKLNYASSGPGTPYHMAGELFKAMSGTVRVTPSRCPPGSWWYSSAKLRPAISIWCGNCAVVMPAASWRMRSSRLRNSSFGLALSASPRQASNDAPVRSRRMK